MKYGHKVVFDLEGFFEGEYKETVGKLMEDGIVTFHGFQPDPKPYYLMSHCIVLPSYHESMSNVLLEAAATGRALIISDIPGCREAVEDGINGFLCEKMDKESLEKCLEKFILINFDMRKEMGIAGRKKMEKEFDKRIVVKNTVDEVLNFGLREDYKNDSE